MPEAVTVSQVHGEPFRWSPQEELQCQFAMVDGVMRVWADEEREQQLFAPPGSATDFFSGWRAACRGLCCRHQI
jgi:threonine synthase